EQAVGRTERIDAVAQSRDRARGKLQLLHAAVRDEGDDAARSTERGSARRRRLLRACAQRCGQQEQDRHRSHRAIVVAQRVESIAVRTLTEQFATYGGVHVSRANIGCHVLGIPMIYGGAVGMLQHLRHIPVGAARLDFGMLALVVLVYVWARLDWRLAL